ncbi:hypothetical protein BDC45DRAFT_451753, partial [Circinella umbellata]
LVTIEHHCNIHLTRQLSIRGTSTVLNTLILSKLWHVLRVIGASVTSFTHVLNKSSVVLFFIVFYRKYFTTNSAFLVIKVESVFSTL